MFFQLIYSLFSAYFTLCYAVGVVVVTAGAAAAIQVARDPALRANIVAAYRLAKVASVTLGGARGNSPPAEPHQRVAAERSARVVMQPAAAVKKEQ
jgi:hypothetical protein